MSLIESNNCAHNNFEFTDGVGSILNTQFNDMHEMQEIISENELSVGGAQKQTQTYCSEGNSQQKEYSADIKRPDGTMRFCVD